MRTLSEAKKDLENAQYELVFFNDCEAVFRGAFGNGVRMSLFIKGIIFSHPVYYEPALLKLFIEFYEIWESGGNLDGTIPIK